MISASWIMIPFAHAILINHAVFGVSQECCNKEEIYTGTKLPYSCKHILTDYPTTPSGYYVTT